MKISLGFLTRGCSGIAGFAACAVFFTACGWAQEELTYKYKEGKRDPFVPLITPAGYLVNLEPEKEAALRLEGVMYDPEGESMAIINGALVKVGESIGDAVVSSIEPDKVIVIKDNQKMEIELRRGEK